MCRHRNTKLKGRAASLAVTVAAALCHVPFSNHHRDEEGCEVFWTAGNSHRHGLKNKKVDKIY